MQRLSVVVVHGSFSTDYAQEFQDLMERVQQLIDHPVCGAYLECSDQPLTAQIAAFVDRHAVDAVVQILPLFLLPGVHVEEDIPKAIADLRAKFPQITWQQLDYLGKNCRLAPFLQPQFEPYPTVERILITHGSRRTGANPEIETLAHHLQAHTAYWATEPSLHQTVTRLLPQQPEAFCLVPYFLFSGKIPTAIAQQIQELAQTYPDITFHTGQPFGTNPQCAKAIAQTLTKP